MIAPFVHMGEADLEGFLYFCLDIASSLRVANGVEQFVDKQTNKNALEPCCNQMPIRLIRYSDYCQSDRRAEISSKSTFSMRKLASE